MIILGDSLGILFLPEAGFTAALQTNHHSLTRPIAIKWQYKLFNRVLGSNGAEK